MKTKTEALKLVGEFADAVTAHYRQVNENVRDKHAAVREFKAAKKLNRRINVSQNSFQYSSSVTVSSYEAQQH